jgi:Fe-S-cluster containining protein
VAFECNQCGSCCHHLGLVFAIISENGPYEYQVKNQYTGESHIVRVDEDKRILFDDQSSIEDLKEACPFFRYKKPEAKAYCTIHLTRPEICRDYGCWRLLICDHRGKQVGKIMFARTFCSDNAVLQEIWSQSIEELSPLPDDVWEREMVQRLSRAGYSVLR